MYKITISKISHNEEDFHTNWSINVKCKADEQNADPNVFVFHARPSGDTYSNVASLHDMSSIPVNSDTTIVNDDGKVENIPYYRTNEVTLDFCNTVDAAHFVDIVKYDILLLVKEYKAARKLVETLEVVI